MCAASDSESCVCSCDSCIVGVGVGRRICGVFVVVVAVVMAVVKGNAWWCCVWVTSAVVGICCESVTDDDVTWSGCVGLVALTRVLEMLGGSVI